MSQRTFFPQRIAKLPLTLALAASSIVLTTGCANMATTAAPTNALLQQGGLTGILHGGNQPIGGATVDLWTVGTSGYGSKGTKLATTTTKTDGTGSFSFNVGNSTTPVYSCPSGNPLLYVIASGGNPLNDGSNANNTAAVMMAAVGRCSGAGSLFINVNEVSSVATVFALQQFINPGATTGAGATATVGANIDYTVSPTSQAALGLTNAFATISNLATISTGTAVTSNTYTGGATTTVATATVTVTPETSKINTIADILAACVNNASASATNCTSLFAAAVPPADASVTSQPTAHFPTAGDTLQALYYMAVNPVNSNPTNLGNLFALASASSPFQPTLATQPTDWTIGVSFNSGTSTCSNSSLFINYPYANSVDGSGNIWMANGGSSTLGALTEMSPIGLPMACSGLVTGARGGAAIDTASNVWITNSNSTNIVKFDGTNTTTIPTGTGTKPYAVAADGKGNVFFTDSTGYRLYELPSTATATTTPTLIGTVTSTSPYGLAVDSKGVIIVGQSGAGGSVISAYAPTTLGGTVYPSTPTTITSATNLAGAYSFAVDASDNFWISNSGGTAGTSPGNTTSYITPVHSATVAGAADTVTFTLSTPSTVYAGGLATARNVAVDGAGNVWFANNTIASNTVSGTTANTLYAVSEFTKGGVALSPTNVVSTTVQNGGFQKAATIFTGLRGMAIDPSGNVWTSSTGSTSNTIMAEIVGAAVPVITPISTQLSTGGGPVKP